MNRSRSLRLDDDVASIAIELSPHTNAHCVGSSQRALAGVKVDLRNGKSLLAGVLCQIIGNCCRCTADEKRSGLKIHQIFHQVEDAVTVTQHC